MRLAFTSAGEFEQVNHVRKMPIPVSAWSGQGAGDSDRSVGQRNDRSRPGRKAGKDTRRGVEIPATLPRFRGDSVTINGGSELARAHGINA